MLINFKYMGSPEVHCSISIRRCRPREHSRCSVYSTHVPNGSLHIHTHIVTLLDNLLVWSTCGKCTKNHQRLTRDVSNHKKALKYLTTTECHYSSKEIQMNIWDVTSVAIAAHMEHSTVSTKSLNWNIQTTVENPQAYRMWFALPIEVQVCWNPPKIMKLKFLSEYMLNLLQYY